MGLFYSSPSKPNFFRIGRGRPSLCGPLKKPRNTALTWFPKLLNRIRALPQNLALGMKTHRILPGRDRNGRPDFVPGRPCER